MDSQDNAFEIEYKTASGSVLRVKGTNLAEFSSEARSLVSKINEAECGIPMREATASVAFGIGNLLSWTVAFALIGIVAFGSWSAVKAIAQPSSMQPQSLWSK